MSHTLHFRIWVANAVHAVSGIWPYEWRGLERKRPLTYSDSRAAACQVAFVDFSDESKRANKRARQLAKTNKANQDEKPRLH